MNKREIKRQLVEMLDAGRSKTETFNALSGGKVKDRVLAAWIGGRPDPTLRKRHSGKVTFLVVLTGILGIIGMLAGFVQINDGGIAMALAMMLIVGVIPLLFAWGFYKGIAVVYTIYVTFTISQVPRMFAGYSEEPVSTVLGVVFTLAMMFYAAWVKSLLFPDLALIGAKKIKGQFVFSN
ncbi:hypothetical protein [Pseudomonas sp. Irchel 3E19]|uniref:DUF2157 domain-containing protein n=1 Tax=Pseudomonas baetica TaxID=674054 RepID=A0ABX4Q7R9_9PSED|nr:MULTISPECIES: hypothetical protein [Pseudomonas]PKA72849.1 hypothetical protein ATI02_5950 [Pseudomonas baetica]PTC19008.1 hypothetical protein C0J26_11215 [Pseudomonas baetica]